MHLIFLFLPLPFFIFIFLFYFLVAKCQMLSFDGGVLVVIDEAHPPLCRSMKDASPHKE